VIVGIDANPQALDAISQGTNFEASVAQDLTGIARTVGSLIETYLNKGTIAQKNYYLPATFVTAANVKDFIKK